MFYDGENSWIRLNDGDKITGDAGPGGNAGGASIGNFMNMDVAELIVYITTILTNKLFDDLTNSEYHTKIDDIAT